uniref:ANIS5_cation-bd domain-containing protein n=2 Tax=Ascaris TaxID=6251 RepID=A0A0M3II98_ASCLU|nr:AsSLR8.97 [Ascaris suum]
MNAFMLTATVVVAVSASGWKEAPVPVYLLNAPDTVKEAFYNIVSNTSMTVEERESAITSFIQQQSPQIQAAYSQFQQALEAAKSAAVGSVPQIAPQ